MLAAAVAFLVFAYKTAGQRSFSGYTLNANFSSIDGLQSGGDVRISGVKIGEVTSITIDPETYLAKVQFTVAPEIKVPTDSVASVATDGLLGGKFIGVLPGSSDDMLKPGARITHTQAAVSLESLIGQFMYSGQGSSKSSSQSGGAQSSGGAPSGGGAAANPAHP